jgi:hypothetical protein
MLMDFPDFESQQRPDLLKVERCRERAIALYQVSVFDLVQARFDSWIRALMLKLGRYEQFQRTEPPMGLFGYAEKLARAKALQKRSRIQ